MRDTPPARLEASEYVRQYVRRYLRRCRARLGWTVEVLGTPPAHVVEGRAEVAQSAHTVVARGGLDSLSYQVDVHVGAEEQCLVDAVRPDLARVARVVLAEVALVTLALRDTGRVGWGAGERRTRVCGVVRAVVVLLTDVARGGQQAAAWTAWIRAAWICAVGIPCTGRARGADELVVHIPSARAALFPVFAVTADGVGGARLAPERELHAGGVVRAESGVARADSLAFRRGGVWWASVFGFVCTERLWLAQHAEAAERLVEEPRVSFTARPRGHAPQATRRGIEGTCCRVVATQTVCVQRTREALCSGGAVPARQALAGRGRPRLSRRAGVGRAADFCRFVRAVEACATRHTGVFGPSGAGGAHTRGYAIQALAGRGISWAREALVLYEGRVLLQVVRVGWTQIAVVWAGFAGRAICAWSTKNTDVSTRPGRRSTLRAALVAGLADARSAFLFVLCGVDTLLAARAGLRVLFMLSGHGWHIVSRRVVNALNSASSCIAKLTTPQA